MQSTKKTPPIISGGWPIAGHGFEYLKDRLATISRGYKEEGDIFTINIFGKKFAHLINPKYGTKYFDLTDSNILRADLAYPTLKPIIGDNVLCANPQVYENKFPTYIAPFSPTKLVKYKDIMIQEIQLWMSGLKDEGEFELVHEIENIAKNVAAHCLIGKKFRDEMNDEFWSLFHTMALGIDHIIPNSVPLPKFRRREKAKQRMREILTPIIEERRANRDKYDDVLQAAVNTPKKDGSYMDVNDITDHIIMLCFAGHDTTKGQAAWAVIQLLQNPEYLKLVQQEIDSVLPDGQPVSPRILFQIPHVTYAIQESMRMRPVSSFVVRVAVEDIEIGDYLIPKEWYVVYAIQHAQQYEGVYSHPEKFDPFRFSPERSEHKAEQYAMGLFGGGIHVCKGMNFAQNEMKLIIALLFKHFDFEIIRPKDPQPVFEGNATSPEKTYLRYKRKKNVNIPVSDKVMKEALDAGCPHMTNMNTPKSSN